MTYESVRDFSAVFGFVFMASTYFFAVFWTFRRHARAAHERAAVMIFDEKDLDPAKEVGRGR